MPILVINPIPGQEEENAEYLEEMNLAVWLKRKDNFEDTVKNALKDENLEKLKQNIQKFSKANSAEEICKIIFKDFI